MKFLQKKHWIVDYTLILIGTFCVAFATGALYSPTKMVTGGVGGTAIIINGLTKGIINGGVPLWFSNILLNVPLFFYAYIRHGFKYIFRTFISVALVTIWLIFIPPLNSISQDLFLVSLFGGIIMGVGIGCVLLAQTTTGGTDMLAVLLHEDMKKRFTIGQVMQIIDAIIIGFGIVIFGIVPSLYAIFSVYIMSKIADNIIDGLKFAKAAYIITDHSDNIAKVLMTEIERGVTSIECKGMYSGLAKNMLVCVVSKNEIVDLRQTVLKIDPNAFIIINDVREVFGEGFLIE